VEEAARVASDVAPVQARQIPLYLALGDRDGAERAARAAVRLSPGSPAALNNLGNVLSIGGRWEESRAVFEEALRYAPDFAPAHANLASVHFGTGRVSAAVTELERALALDPGMVNARYNLALVYLETGKPADAAERLAEILESQPRHGPTLRLMESLQSGRGLPPGATLRLTFTY
jgi:tetratricopeptide (TPR) repeat protein